LKDKELKDKVSEIKDLKTELAKSYQDMERTLKEKDEAINILERKFRVKET
jgi:hypothetical protein